MRLSIDTGGTFTDLVVEDANGVFAVYKRPTTPLDPVLGILDVIGLAAEDRGMTSGELLGGAHTLIHATTHSLNALLTDTVAKTGLIVTTGHPDILRLREGGREHFNVRAPFPEPLIPRSLTFPVTERITSSGSVLVPLDEDRARSVARQLGDHEIEAVAVCLLWSIVNPAHELEVGVMLEEELPGVPFTLSHRLTPTLREYRRASATAIDASLKPLMGRYLMNLSARLREAGFAARLLMTTSSGALLDVDEVAAAPIHSIKSGPAMAPVAGRVFSEQELSNSSAIVTDAGGTSYDVSAVRRGSIPWTRETWLGTPYLSPLVGFPSVDVKSYGAGGGSIAWVDRGGLLHVGPKSAGADPGPAAYGRGGVSPTFTDAAVVLGYIDPDDFLGGKMKLDSNAAQEAVLSDVGARLGLDAADAAAAIVEVMTEQMANAIEDTALRQGVDPTAAVLVGGGGAAGLNAVGVAARVGCPHVLIPSISAALSAVGALMSDLGKDIVVTHPMKTSSFNFTIANEIVTELTARSRAFLEDMADGSSERGVDFYVEAHYAREVWEIDVPFEMPLAGPDDLDRLRRAFHARHDELYAVSDAGADLEIISWRARAWCRVHSGGIPETRRAQLVSDPSVRRTYFSGHGWLDTCVFPLEQLSGGREIWGPAIVTSPVTTTVVDPGAKLVLTRLGSLQISVPAQEMVDAVER